MDNLEFIMCTEGVLSMIALRNMAWERYQETNDDKFRVAYDKLDERLKLFGYVKSTFPSE